MSERFSGAKTERPSREHALALARELTEVSERQSEIPGSEMPAVKQKMKRLIDAIVALEGSTVERPIGEQHVLRFHQGDGSKPYGEGRMHAFSMSERIGVQEKPMVLAFIDADGGSVLMQPDDQERLLRGATGSEIDPEMMGWVSDRLYEEDIRYLSMRVPAPPALFTRANRFREQRMVARMAQLLLSAGATA